MGVELLLVKAMEQIELLLQLVKALEQVVCCSSLQLEPVECWLDQRWECEAGQL